MKKILLPVAVTLVVSGCYITQGGRTVFWSQDNTVSITRTMASDGSADTWTTAACIALPSDWSGDVSVAVNGTALVDSTETAFTTTGSAYAAGTTAMTTELPLSGLDWQCFSDQSREYSGDSSGEITFSFTPESNEALIYTTLGVISDGSRDSHYYDNLASHQILRGDTVADYWSADDEIGSSDVSMSLVHIDGTDYFFSRVWSSSDADSSLLYRVTDSDTEQLADIPATSTLLKVNGYYFSLRDIDTEIDGNNQTWTHVRYSTDLTNWSEAYTLPHISTLMWNEHDAEYVAVLNDYHPPYVNGVYTSMDLQSWTYEKWIQEQSVSYAFLSDGTAFAVNSNSYVTPFHIRQPDSDTWVATNLVPQKQGETRTHQFTGSRLTETNGVLHVTATRRFLDTSAPEIEVENVFYGRSTDAENWVWTDLGSYEDVGFRMELIALSNGTLLFIGSNDTLISTDNGATWEAMVSPIAALGLSDTLGVVTNARINEVIEYGTGYLLSVSSGVDSSALSFQALLYSEDLASYELLAMSSRVQLLKSMDNQIAFVEYGDQGYRVVRQVAAATDTDGDYISDATDTDDDGDGVSDDEDAFPLDASETTDTDGDRIGNNADTDDDGDDVSDDEDAFPLDASETTDTDGDRIGNNADTDDDGDGVSDDEDAFPLDASETTDTDGDRIGNNADTDDDGDGVSDDEDAFPLDETKSRYSSNSGGGSLSWLNLLFISLLLFRRRLAGSEK